jgi:hypothetical protein
VEECEDGRLKVLGETNFDQVYDVHGDRGKIKESKPAPEADASLKDLAFDHYRAVMAQGMQALKPAAAAATKSRRAGVISSGPASSGAPPFKAGKVVSKALSADPDSDSVSDASSSGERAKDDIFDEFLKVSKARLVTKSALPSRSAGADHPEGLFVGRSSAGLEVPMISGRSEVCFQQLVVDSYSFFGSHRDPSLSTIGKSCLRPPGVRCILWVLPLGPGGS